MKKGDRVFVYGTLRRGERADIRKFCARDVIFCCDDVISARMYHIGSFPGVKLVAGEKVWQPRLPSVVGEVFRIIHPSVTALLDAYEGYDADHPEMGHYDRCEVETKSGLLVWVYLYNPMVIPDQLIESGDWCKSPSTIVSHRMIRQ